MQNFYIVDKSFFPYVYTTINRHLRNFYGIIFAA